MDEITNEEAKQFLYDAPVAHIGVIVDGEPYVTTMSFVIDGDRIMFRTKPGRRLAAIETNPAVSIEASHYDEETGDWTSVIVRGRARENTDREVGAATLQALMHKYERVLGSPLGRSGIQPMASFPRVVEVEIIEITGMSSGRGFGMRTRPGRL